MMNVYVSLELYVAGRFTNAFPLPVMYPEVLGYTPAHAANELVTPLLVPPPTTVEVDPTSVLPSKIVHVKFAPGVRLGAVELTTL